MSSTHWGQFATDFSGQFFTMSSTCRNEHLVEVMSVSDKMLRSTQSNVTFGVTVSNQTLGGGEPPTERRRPSSIVEPCGCTFHRLPNHICRGADVIDAALPYIFYVLFLALNSYYNYAMHLILETWRAPRSQMAATVAGWLMEVVAVDAAIQYWGTDRDSSSNS